MFRISIGNQDRIFFSKLIPFVSPLLEIEIEFQQLHYHRSEKASQYHQRTTKEYKIQYHEIFSQNNNIQPKI